MKKMYRQGDVLIIPVDEANVGKEITRDAGRIILAYGEVTGHAHAITDKGARMFRLAEDRTEDGDRAWARAERILRVSAKAGVEIRHEEHATIQLPPGTYRVRIQREWSGEDERPVQD